MKKTAKQALKSILAFCEGYESEGREVGKDYKNLKKFVKKQKKECEQ